uniref:Putative metalloproteinase inhibitor tag-225 (inferred by orthology to a C. elegans protein) n=1 Tax=Strongyloides venezuelensis TaxID=75913 RepID=A0A0K0F1K3_STRVS
MIVVFLYSVLLSCLFLLGDSCNYTLQSFRTIYCNTDWTYHVKIVGKHILNNVGDNGGSGLISGTNILYEFERIMTFKSTKRKIIKNVIYVLNSDPTYRITRLEINKEYLLSGYLKDGLLTTDQCSQIHSGVSNDHNAVPQEWITVPASQKFTLRVRIFSRKVIDTFCINVTPHG